MSDAYIDIETLQAELALDPPPTVIDVRSRDDYAAQRGRCDAAPGERLRRPGTGRRLSRLGGRCLPHRTR